ncbi:RnfH family protein [Vibrio maritimus]|uniref:RnfH family protein n=1 Tax=Vibrio maritimus TaxID=990268 RepID=UPI0037366229
MKVSVVYALESKQVWLPVEVEVGATLMSAIHESRILTMFPSIDLEQQRVGVFGKLSSLEAVVNEGDRIEIYRPLIWVAQDDE